MTCSPSSASLSRPPSAAEGRAGAGGFADGGNRRIVALCRPEKAMIRLPASLALIAVFGLAACQPPAETPAADTSADTAVTPVQSTAVMPADAPPQEEAVVPEGELLGEGDRTCRDTIGEAASARLVARCIAVSPATRPPCNADNVCALIQDEIDRACGQYGPGEAKPAECTA